MNRLLIVDDEIEILEWLEEMFLYDVPRELEIHAASSAREALELLDQIPFEVVLTDIKMPGMDGFQFFDKIKENWPGCKVVFLTGYRNFEDIYRVINHQDVRYVLKSEDDEVIVKAVEDFFIQLEEQQSSEQMHCMEIEKLKRARYWLRKEFIDNIMMHQNTIIKNANYQQEFGLDVDFHEDMLLALLRLDHQSSDDAMTENGFYLLEQLTETFIECLPKWLSSDGHVLENGYLLLFIQPDGEHRENWGKAFTMARGALEFAQTNFNRKYNRTFTAVISSEAAAIAAVSQEVSCMRQILVGYLGNADTAIIHMQNILLINEPEQEPGIELHDPGMLKNYLELRREEEYFTLLQSICRQISAGKGRHDMKATELYYHVGIVLLQFINENQIYQQLAFYTGLYKLLNLKEHENWLDACDYLMNLSRHIFTLLGKHEDSLSDRAMSRVVKYIEDHIDGDLSLTKLADVGGFNASYLSRLFKQIHKITVTDYVLKKRMSAAKKLLSETQDKIQDISAKTGYVSSHSFSRAFRNYTGLSPAEYREAHLSRKKQ